MSQLDSSHSPKEMLRTKVLNKLWESNSGLWKQCWKFTDAYGPLGYMPPQGYDWSGFRDSSDQAIRNMADYLGIPMDYPVIDRD